MKIAVYVLNLCLMATLEVNVALAADAARPHGITVERPWIAVPPPGAPTAAAYLRLHNSSGRPDRLLSVDGTVAASISLHATLMEDDVMKMRPQHDIEVPAQGMVELAPGGLHVMLTGLRTKLAEGDVVPLKLNFEHAGEITVEMPVKPRTADIDSHGQHGQ